MAYITEAEVGGSIGLTKGDFLLPHETLKFDSRKMVRDYKTQNEVYDGEVQDFYEQNKNVVEKLTTSEPIPNRPKEGSAGDATYLQIHGQGVGKKFEHSLFPWEGFGGTSNMALLIVVIFVVFLVFAYMQSLEIRRLHKIIKTLLTTAPKV